MVSNAERIGHNRQRWIHGAARGKEAPIDHVEIVQVVRFAVRIQRRRLRIISKSNRTILVCDARQRNALAKVEISRE